MKKKSLKTEKVLQAWNVLREAKYGKLDDADKIRVWKATRTLKPIAEQFDDDSKDAAERMKPTDDYDERLTKAQEYERMVKVPDFDAEKLPMGPSEYAEFIDVFKRYQKLVGETIKEFAQKEVEVNIDPLSEDAFGRLMASNDWTMAQVDAVGEILM